MPGRTRYPVSIFLVILFILLQVCPVMAQQQPFLDKRVSFTFTATPIANALRAIGNKTGVKFSYNPELILPGKRISMRFSNMLMRDVLKQLLSDPSLSFREIGNQIVIYRGDPSQFPLEPNQQLIQGKPQIVVSTKKTPDTIFMYQLDTLIINRRDTILRSISITRFDTIRLTDTVYIEKNKSTQKAGKEVKKILIKTLLNTGNSSKTMVFIPGYTLKYYQELQRIRALQHQQRITFHSCSKPMPAG